jgi:hypothetical protein
MIRAILVRANPAKGILVKTNLVRTIPVSSPARAIPQNNPVREILVREILIREIRVKASRVRAILGRGKAAKATDRTPNVIQVRPRPASGFFLGENYTFNCFNGDDRWLKKRRR